MRLGPEGLRKFALARHPEPVTQRTGAEGWAPRIVPTVVVIVGTGDRPQPTEPGASPAEVVTAHTSNPFSSRARCVSVMTDGEQLNRVPRSRLRLQHLARPSEYERGRPLYDLFYGRHAGGTVKVAEKEGGGSRGHPAGRMLLEDGDAIASILAASRPPDRTALPVRLVEPESPSRGQRQGVTRGLIGDIAALCLRFVYIADIH